MAQKFLELRCKRICVKGSMTKVISQLNISADGTIMIRRRLAVSVKEAGGRQGRLCGYKKAKLPLTKLMNLAWGL